MLIVQPAQWLQKPVIHHHYLLYLFLILCRVHMQERKTGMVLKNQKQHMLFQKKKHLVSDLSKEKTPHYCSSFVC